MAGSAIRASAGSERAEGTAFRINRDERKERFRHEERDQRGKRLRIPRLAGGLERLVSTSAEENSKAEGNSERSSHRAAPSGVFEALKGR